MYAVEMNNITKSFGSSIANDNISISIESGEIHSILGENGAGKSTLMKILAGLYEADNGSISVFGKKENIPNTKVAHSLGIGMVHQHFMLIDNMSVLDNIILGQEYSNGILIDHKKNKEAVESIASSYGFEIDVNNKVYDLSVGMKQRVEIIKVLYRNSNIIIFDEPTAVLTSKESSKLLSIFRNMRDKGKTIIFITHRLEETKLVSDTATILRDGKKIARVNMQEVNEKEIIHYMVGREINLNIEKKQFRPKSVVLELENIKLSSRAEKNISFSIMSGEIFGIAGVLGNGQDILEETIMGIRKPLEGSIKILSENITSSSIKKRKCKGIAYIPSDRHKYGILSKTSILENYLLGHQYSKMFNKFFIINYKDLTEKVSKLIDDFNISIPSFLSPLSQLSGGNQQKMVLSREISIKNVKLIIASEPVRGLDIGAIDFIHKKLIKLRDEGYAILLISADLSEIMKLSDTIAVMCKDTLVDIRRANDFTVEEIGALQSGGKI